LLEFGLKITQSEHNSIVTCIYNRTWGDLDNVAVLIQILILLHQHLAGGALLLFTKAMHGGCFGLIMETHHLRRTARDHGNRGTGLYGLRWHGGAGMGIHDGGEWQLKVKSWELDMVRRVLLEEGRRMEKVGRCFWKKREFWGERGIFGTGAQGLVASFTDFLPLR
jgi:hypothetical protein